MAKMTIDQKQIRELAALLEETNLTEIELREGERSIRVSRATRFAQEAPAPTPQPSPEQPPPSEEPSNGSLTNHPGAVLSPMVGTVYVAPEPGTEPFVKVGDKVSEGQTLFIIEAMKTMNPIPAPRAGIVSQILISDGLPVEFGEPLMVIE